MDEEKKIAILGAGVGGLSAIKACKEEGFDPVCFEKTDHIGGLWHYTPDAKDGEACVNKSTIINTSKEIISFSDFPVPKEFPIFMHNAKVLEYIHMYAEHFDLKKFIHFKVEVIQVKRATDYEKNGRWDLKIKDLNSGEVKTETFDAVLLCTGHNTDKYIPNIDGDDDFQGDIIHTHDFKDDKGLEGKNVVILGIGNSAADLAVNIASICNQVYISTRRGAWVVNRIGENGIPLDMLDMGRFQAFISSMLPFSIRNTLMENKLNKFVDHHIYGLRPKHRIFSALPTVSGDLPYKIACGSILIKPNIKKIHPNAVEFEDGTTASNVDTIILGTGYVFGFPFLEKGIIDVYENRFNLYKYMFPPDLKHPTLGAVGFIQAWGPSLPIIEMQCRWAAMIFKSKRKLPTKADMWDDIEKKREEMKVRFVSSQRHTIQVDYLDYLDQIAQQIGCIPDIKRLLLTDPKLAWNVVFGPVTSYQYRIHGPNAWLGSREALLNMWKRTLYPLNPRLAERPDTSHHVLHLMLLITLIFAIIFKFIF